MPNRFGATAVPATRGAADGPDSRASEKATTAHVVAQRRTALVVHLGRLGLLLGAIALWQLASGPLIDPYFASKPSEIVDAFARLIATDRFFPNLWLTVQEALYGYLIGASLGVVAAVVLGSSARLLAILEPFLLVIFATPSVALAPLIIVWLGLGIAPKIVLAAYFVFLLVFMNGVAGVRGVPKGLMETALVMGASQFQIFRKIVLRSALPHVMTGLRTAMPQAVVGAMVGEFISSRRGLGFLIAEATGRFDTAAAFAGIITISLIVLTMFMLLQLGNELRLRPQQ